MRTWILGALSAWLAFGTIGCARRTKPVEAPPPPPARFPFDCFGLPAASQAAGGYVCFEPDRFVMWAGPMHESRLTEWRKYSEREWRGRSEGAFSPTLDLRLVRAGDHVRFSLGEEEVVLHRLSAAERAKVEAERADLPVVEDVCAASRRCFAAVVGRLAQAQDGAVPGDVPRGRSVVECRMQREGALGLLTGESEVPDACREPRTANEPAN